jgi:DNA polymerase-3 subunit delta'
LFPNKKSSEETLSTAHLRNWRAELTRSVYLDTKRWYAAMGTENQQPIINVKDAAYMSDALSLTAQQGGYRVVIIWHAELINEQAANKILKILEEPPTKTVIILITDTPERLLQTIVSRTQCIEFPALSAEEIQDVLVKQHGMTGEMAMTIARSANGSYTQAANLIQANEETAIFFDLFVQLMRKCYMRDIKEMQKWSELVAEWGREKQKNFLRYCQHMVRENFIFNFHEPDLNYLATNEREFSTRFSPFINERNVIGIMEELSLAERDITQNVNPRMVFFDFALKMIVLLIK